MSQTSKSYEIEALSKGWKVLEALRGKEFEPVTLQRVVKRTGFNTNYCFRALKTFESLGCVKQIEDGRWTVTPRIMRFSEHYEQAMDDVV